MTLMKQLPSADFRKKYTAQAEPVEVTAHGKVIGTWIPFGTKAPASAEGLIADGIGDEAAETGPEAPEKARMTIRPVKSTKKPMVGTSQRLIDPLEVARRERAMYSQLASRLYGPRKQRPSDG